MTALTELLTLQGANMENTQMDLSTIISKQILSDSTNNQSKNSENNTSVDIIRRSQQSSLALATFRRYKEAAKRKYQSEKIKNDIEMSKDIQKVQQDNQQVSSDEDEQFRIQQRALYNARQTPLIPLVADLDFSLLSESSEEQDDLLMEILSLIHNVHEECSFYEQFQI